MNKIIDKLPALVEEELQAANAVHPLFHSPHEGYAVLLEEVEEAHDALINVELMLKEMWKNVKADAPVAASTCAYFIESAAQSLAAEAIQVAAMARKYQQSREEMGVNAFRE